MRHWRWSFSAQHLAARRGVADGGEPLAVNEAYHLDIGPGPLQAAWVRVVAAHGGERDGMWDVGVEFF